MTAMASCLVVTRMPLNFKRLSMVWASIMTAESGTPIPLIDDDQCGDGLHDVNGRIDDIDDGGCFL
jgi:hypothetical protein